MLRVSPTYRSRSSVRSTSTQAMQAVRTSDQQTAKMRELRRDDYGELTVAETPPTQMKTREMTKIAAYHKQTPYSTNALGGSESSNTSSESDEAPDEDSRRPKAQLLEERWRRRSNENGTRRRELIEDDG